jgi:hypothetical protein
MRISGILVPVKSFMGLSIISPKMKGFIEKWNTKFQASPRDKIVKVGDMV